MDVKETTQLHLIPKLRTSASMLLLPHTPSSRTLGRERRNLKVCKSVHHRSIQIDHQPDATVFQFVILTFIYSSTSFGPFPAHHQELNDCSGSLWFYLRIVVTVMLCSWSGWYNRPDHEHNTTITTIQR